MEEHTHDYWMLYAQPRIKEGILIERCDCGAEREMDAETFFEEECKQNRVSIFDFNNPPEGIESE